MKKLIGFGLLALSISGSLMAGEFQSISGQEAYDLYQKLPGVKCQEYRLANYIVYSKYQTKSCSENQTDASKWNCTVQLELKNGKVNSVISADCSREI
ncbi:hypothetical protein DOM21_02990 [Bacteriovorax stolpii]|uniref:hypothetical protein n=1 Tax=Bacteriovorax stolpii TaxID=960 RepID=UPI00115A7304|nr:hypothetical protein [Bacteriovorax stolpii]QDK40436.1 hypothetical protein DOM21_02990 [Bacteriovorax stolpii]